MQGKRNSKITKATTTKSQERFIKGNKIIFEDKSARPLFFGVDICKEPEVL